MSTTGATLYFLVNAAGNVFCSATAMFEEEGQIYPVEVEDSLEAALIMAMVEKSTMGRYLLAKIFQTGRGSVVVGVAAVSSSIPMPVSDNPRLAFLSQPLVKLIENRQRFRRMGEGISQDKKIKGMDDLNLPVWMAVEYTANQLVTFKNVGRKTVMDLEELLEPYGLKLGTRFPPDERAVLERIFLDRISPAPQ
jgi:hypothetical protein